MLKNKELTCADCLPPLMFENVDAINIWNITRDQLVFAGMAGVLVGPNHLAIWKAIDEYNIKNRTRCFEKVISIFAHFTENERERRKAEEAGREKK